MSDDGTFSRDDALGSFLKFADDMRDIWQNYARPAMAETCSCGGTVEVSKDVPAAERRRIYAQFSHRHRVCAAKRLEQIGETDE